MLPDKIEFSLEHRDYMEMLEFKWELFDLVLPDIPWVLEKKELPTLRKSREIEHYCIDRLPF